MYTKKDRLRQGVKGGQREVEDVLETACKGEEVLIILREGKNVTEFFHRVALLEGWSQHGSSPRHMPDRDTDDIRLGL